MNLLPKTHEKFASKDYWDVFFQKRGDKAFEWYGEYSELSKYLHKYIKVLDNVLVVGCGNSSLSSNLFDVGFKNITSIDISEVAINQMIKINSNKRPSLQFLYMDALNMTFENEQFAVVLDKGTLDALVPNKSPDVLEKASQYLNEVERVMKFGGRFICVSLLQDHILQLLLSYFPKKSWMFRVVRCFEAEQNAAENGQKIYPVFIVICTKFKNLPQEILEVNITSNESIQRLKSHQEVIDIITDVQQSAVVSFEIKNIPKKEYKEFSLELFKAGEITPRFIIYVVNLPFERKRGQYAAFIVPQGRETEWLFSTKDGRIHLTKTSNFNRLVIVTLCRDQKYDSYDSVTAELKSTVQNFAPPSVTGKILFLSLGSDVGNRTILHEGESKLTGKYVIEDVEVDGDIFRRLVFLRSQNVVQSEGKVKIEKTKKGQPKKVMNHLYLASQYNVYMAVGCDFVCNSKQSSSVAVVGLGGGSLCMFLRRFLPDPTITAVDLDPEVLQVAQKWFDLQLDEKLKVEIKDGIEFIKENAENGVKFDCLILDVDSKDTSLGMSGPPKEFIEPCVLENIKRCLKSEGILLLNLIIRDKLMRPSVIKLLSEHFKTVITYQLEEDLNEVVFCFEESLIIERLKLPLSASCQRLNKFLKNNKQQDHMFEIEDYLNKLKIES